ncbi:MAG TPA: DNA-binding protein WhiA [Candidatus Limnocylindrales bacterium]|nr:DNA-binding protein WhiA [Candidatus Limnocylindrales bacterium]
MSGSDRDLVLALRSELAALDPARPCDRRAEAIALADVGAARDGPLARLLLRLARERAAVQAAAGDEAPGAIDPAAGGIRRFDWAASADHCRLAWLRGMFLAHGSLSLSGGRTHLEFLVAAPDAELLARWLDQADLPASWRIRRGRGVVTWKNGDLVGTFLRRIGAIGALLEVEARQVSRAMRGDLNRVINAESANLHRAVGAAGRQIAAIDELTASGELAEQPFVIRSVAEARHETPEATFAELAERLGIHRSAVQRALERIERLARMPDDDERRRRRMRRSREPAGPRSAPAPAAIGRPLA